MVDDEIKNITADMEKQGFPLEVNTSRILEAHGWEVTNQPSYLDFETRKTRTLDILAEKNVVLGSKLTLDIWLCVECKKVSNPWVFYAADLDLSKEELRRKIVSSTHFSATKKGNPQKLSGIVFNNFILKNRYPESIFSKLAYNSFEPFTGGKGLSIQKARMQVSNMVYYLETSLGNELTSTMNTPYFLLYIPVIVLEGNLFVYEDDQLTRSDGLFYHLSRFQATYVIDVVRAVTFEKYLDNLEQMMSKFQAEMK